MCACVCVCEREREREREGNSERARERGRERERVRKKETVVDLSYKFRFNCDHYSFKAHWTEALWGLFLCYCDKKYLTEMAMLEKMLHVILHHTWIGTFRPPSVTAPFPFHLQSSHILSCIRLVWKYVFSKEHVLGSSWILSFVTDDLSDIPVTSTFLFQLHINGWNPGCDNK